MHIKWMPILQPYIRLLILLSQSVEQKHELVSARCHVTCVEADSEPHYPQEPGFHEGVTTRPTSQLCRSWHLITCVGMRVQAVSLMMLRSKGTMRMSPPRRMPSLMASSVLIGKQLVRGVHCLLHSMLLRLMAVLGVIAWWKTSAP